MNCIISQGVRNLLHDPDTHDELMKYRADLIDIFNERGAKAALGRVLFTYVYTRREGDAYDDWKSFLG